MRCVSRSVYLYILSASAADWWFSTFVFTTFRQGHKVWGFISRDSAVARCGGIIYNIHNIMVFIFFLTQKISFWGGRLIVSAYNNILFDLLSQDPHIPQPRVPNSAARLLSFLRCLFCRCRGPPQVPGGLIVSLSLPFILLVPFHPRHTTLQYIRKK